MGSDLVKPLKPMRAIAAPKCSNDMDCMNPYSYGSEPGTTCAVVDGQLKCSPNQPVFSCPDAKCVDGSCVCGSKCKRDPYSGMCCQGFETIRGQTFCIEVTKSPSEPEPTSAIISSFS